MALALLWSEEPNYDTDVLRLGFDIGHNFYYQWQVGDEEQVKTSGIARIANIKQRSRVLGPLPESARGRGVVEIPRELISKQDRFAQLMSFRTQDGAGPAISPIVELDWTGAQRDVRRPDVNEDLPPPELFISGPPSLSRSFSKGEGEKFLAASSGITDGGLAMSMAHTYSSLSVRTPPVDAVPLRWRERDLSQGMFLEGLWAALPSLLPNLAPMIGNVLTSAAPALGQIVGGLLPGLPGMGGAPAAGGAAGASTGNPQLAQLIEQLLRGLGSSARETLTPDTINKITAAIGGAAPAEKPAAKSLALGSLGARVERCTPSAYARSYAASTRAKRNPRAPRATNYAQAQDYSQAMIAPALLAALPALMPLLQQVLSPQNIQTVVDAPQKMTGQVINGILDFAKLGMQATEAEREHLRKLNPGVDDPALNQLLMSMSQGLASAQRLNYRRVASVKLSFDEAQSQVLFGRSRVLYRKDQALQFPLSVNTPQTIGKARLVLQIKHPDTLAVLVEDGEDVGDLSSGPIPLVPRIDAAQAARLEPNQDYIVVATLLWKTKKNQQVGTSMQQRITVIGEYSFDRVEESGEPVAASDFERYRDLWHKVWEGDFGSGAHSARLDCRYYLVLNPKRTNNARMDTHVEADGNTALGGKLKAGMEYSPYVLNHLLTRLAPNTAPLSDAELEALAGSDFVERFNQAAQFSGKLKGRRGERGALWVYPEFKIQTLVLTRAGDVDEHGNVRTLDETRVRFPMPVMMHFVGVKGA
ncbi:MAG: hypothetical protein HY273_16280 [Gammaproteobacteria bacterium]|nr:hypothetical protein [Gammaproteobacteria bacterium]